MIAFIDIDNVLGNFPRSALKVLDWEEEEFYLRHPPGLWDMTPTLRLSPMDFWRRISRYGQSFWIDIEPTDYFSEVLTYADSEFDEWWLCTSPFTYPSSEGAVHCAASYAGKVRWIQNHFGINFDRFYITTKKELLARPGRYLIDDREETVRKFTSYGGAGIIFPCHFNSLHEFKDDPIETVRLQHDNLRRQFRDG